MPAKRPKTAARGKEPKAAAPAQRPESAKAAVAASAESCPRCGTPKFAPEDRIRVEGARTVRYTVLVCERGHTFAKPRVA